MKADGAVSGASLPGRWTASGDDRYLIRWSTYTDQLVLADDERTLTGVNNYGLPAKASRLGDAPTDLRSLAGSWKYNNIPATASADGGLVAGPYQGRWRSSGTDTFVMEWAHQPIDDLAVVGCGPTVLQKGPRAVRASTVSGDIRAHAGDLWSQADARRPHRDG